MSESFDDVVLNLPDDYEGKVIATLIISKYNISEQLSVLYVHGFFDYFFHPHLAELFLQHKINFFALDLRKCGRSICERVPVGDRKGIVIKIICITM